MKIPIIQIKVKIGEEENSCYKEAVFFGGEKSW